LRVGDVERDDACPGGHLWVERRKERREKLQRGREDRE
jgi:hypothetical protein